MTRTELKMALKLHHHWKINFRITYATLLMRYTEGKILSMFESALSEEIAFNHLHGIYDNEIDWCSVYTSATRAMARFAKEVSNGEI